MSDPQHDPAAETAVLGSVISSPKALDACIPLLRPEDFYTPANEALWDVIAGLHEAGQPVTAITVKDALTTSGRLTQVGGLPYLAELATQGLSPVTAPAHARIVARHATSRRLQAAGTRIVQLSSDGETHPVELVNLAAAELASAHRPANGDTKTRIGDFIDDVLDDLEHTDRPAGLEWPWIDAKRVLNPLTPGQLVIAAGRPGAGKSVLCVDVARDIAFRQGKTVVLHSLEMSKEELTKRIIAAEARVDLSHIQSRDLTPTDWERVAAAATRFRESDLHIIDNASTGISDIRAAIKQHDPAIVVLDYIQLGAVDPKLDRRVAVEKFTRELKVLAKESHIPILTAAQLGRGPEMRQDHTPVLSDLRETGGLENDADTVILLFRPDYYDAECPRAGELDLIVAKQRNGAPGTVPLAHQLHYSRFQNLAA